MTNHDVSGSLLTTMSTALVALLPDETVSYAGKVISVFLLAVIAELGRRFVGKIWKAKS